MTPKIRRIGTVLLTVVALAVVPLYAQDSSQVLALSVNYRTLKNTTQLDNQLRQELESIERQARAASQSRRYGDAMGHYHHAMALLRGQAWTPARALETALQLKTDRVVYDPGDVLRVQITQIFALENPMTGKLSGSLALNRELKSFAELPGDFYDRPFMIEAVIPEIVDNTYRMTLTLTPSNGEPIVKSATIRIARGATAQAAALKARVASVAADLKKRDPNGSPSALAAAEYSASMIDLPNAGPDLLEQLTRASTILDKISNGQNPLRTMTGDFRWAYRSLEDNTLQPYRIYVPTNYDPTKAYPLVVALHGMGGNENSMFNGYGEGAIKREAETRGYIVVCPKGRGSSSMYTGTAERDVIDVLKQTMGDYTIDPDRVYLMGHSMGGYGTWSVAMNHPELFAALAPIAGGGQTAGLSRIVHIPELIIHGDNDPTVSVEESRKMVRAATELGIEVKYVEVPGGDHSGVVVPHLKDVFDWFESHKRKKR